MSQPPTGPPQGPPPPPWGNYPAPRQQPPPPGRGWEIFYGAVIGLVATIAAPFAAFGLSESLGLGILPLALVVVPSAGGLMLISPTTRPWGTGLLIGWAISLVAGAGTCIALLSGLE